MRRFALCHRRVRMRAPAKIIDQMMRAHVFGLPLLIFPSARMCVALSGVRARACARAGVYMWRPVPCRHRAHAWACAIPGNCAAGRECVLCLRSSGLCCALAALHGVCAHVRVWGRASSSLDRPPPSRARASVCSDWRSRACVDTVDGRKPVPHVGCPTTPACIGCWANQP